jgi:hypothetical protein
MRAACTCGQVAFEAKGAPLLHVGCYCDDCQEGSRRLQALPNAPPCLGSDGGTDYVLFRKDRFRPLQGEALLTDHRLRERSPTRRVTASCCNAPMFTDFQKGHWVSVYRDRLSGDVGPVQMRVQTRFKPAGAELPTDAPAYPAFPPKLVAKLLGARIAMLFGR